VKRILCMVFALGGDAALRELEAGSFDVVVTDMRMPGIDGVTLLGLVQERHPGTIRIVFSGQTDQEAALRAAPVAHQFLAKPCDGDHLRRTIDRACLAQMLLGDTGVRRAAGGANTLPSAPALYTKLVEASGDPEASMHDIGALVESDVAMSAKVLQLVNFAPTRPIDGFSVDALELHSACVARLAGALLPGRREAGEAFTAGMLHDVGKLVLAAHRPDELAALLAEARDSARPLHAIEQKRAGVTHAEIGAYLLTLWGLPHRIVEAVARHHAPTRLQATELDPIAAVYIANLLVAEQQNQGDDGTGDSLDRGDLAGLGVADRVGSWRLLAAEYARSCHPDSEPPISSASATPGPKLET
jgi:putative nucleotidyltransferase with HDIG domain